MLRRLKGTRAGSRGIVLLGTLIATSFTGGTRRRSTRRSRRALRSHGRGHDGAQRACSRRRHPRHPPPRRPPPTVGDPSPTVPPDTAPPETVPPDTTPPPSATPPTTSPPPISPSPDPPPAETPGPPKPAPSAPDHATTAARTWAKGCITHRLDPGDRGRQVVCLQNRLRKLNFPVPTTGGTACARPTLSPRSDGDTTSARPGGRARGTRRDLRPPPSAHPPLGPLHHPAVRPGDSSYQVRCLSRRLQESPLPRERRPQLHDP